MMGQYITYAEYLKSVYIKEHIHIMNGVLPGKACIYIREARKHFVAPDHYSLYMEMVETSLIDKTSLI